MSAQAVSRAKRRAPNASISERFEFSDLREISAKANEEKSGDHLSGVSARSQRERVAAKRKLADISLAEIVDQPLINPDADDVSRLILDTFDQAAFQHIRSMTVGEFREYILDDATTEAVLKELQWAVRPETATKTSTCCALIWPRKFLRRHPSSGDVVIWPIATRIATSDDILTLLQ